MALNLVMPFRTKEGGIMKIAIPVVNTNDHKYDIAPGFNTTPYMCVYDSGAGEYNWFSTEEVLSKGENIVSYFEKNNLNAIITSMMKPMALSLFNRMGIKVYKSESNNLVENVLSFEQDELFRYTSDDAIATAHTCGGSCKSCSTPSANCNTGS